MKTQRKHGFTIVELVVVIAIIAVLAAVLIPTFASIIKKANDSAYLQERTNQQIADLAEKVEKINYFTWEDFEKKLAEELAKVGSADTDEIKKAVEAAMKEYATYSQASMTGLTADQVKKIVDEAMAGQLTTAQVEAIVRQVLSGTTVGEETIRTIVNNAVKGMSTTGVTKAQVEQAVKAAISGTNAVSGEQLEAAVTNALKAFGVSILTKEDINGIISSATSDNTTLAKALNIRLANLGIGKQKTVYDMVVKIGGESVITGTNTTSTVLNDTSTLLYDLDDNKFFTVDKDGKVDYDGGLSLSDELNEAYKYWIFANSVDPTYSTYLLSGSNVTSAEVTKGIDVGYKTDVTSITYDRSTATSAQTVVIRTNGGTLTVNAPLDTVMHYGEAQVVTLIAVGTSSYYEHGSVNLVDIKKGRLVITNDAEAEVGTIYLTATNDAYDGIILATQNGSELPDVVAREAVSNPTTGEKLVVTIQTNVDTNGENPTKTEQIYLYPASDVKEATNGYNVSDLGLLVVEAISSEAQTQAAQQITDEEVLEAVKETKTQDLETATYNSFTLPIGTGTQADPYKIYTANAWLEILKMGVANDYIFGDDSGTLITYVSIENDLDFKNVTAWPGDADVSFYNVHVNGNNHNFKNARIYKTNATGVCYLMSSNNRWENMNLVNCTGSLCYGTYYNDPNAKTVFDNVNIYSGSTNNGFYGRYCGYSTTEIYNCTIDSNSTVTQSGFAGGGFLGNTGNGHFLIQNCVNHGTVVGNGDNFGPFVGQGCSSKTDGKYWGLVKDSTFDGTLIAYGNSATKIRMYGTYAEGENVDYSNCTIIVPSVSAAKVSLGNGDSYISVEAKADLNIIASDTIKFDSEDVMLDGKTLKVVELDSAVKRLEIKQYINYNLKKTDGSVAPHYNFIANSSTVDCSGGKTAGETLFTAVDVLQIVGNDTTNRKSYNTTDDSHTGLYNGTYYFDAVTRADGSYNYLAVDGPNGSVSGFITIYAYGEDDAFLGSVQISFYIQ